MSCSCEEAISLSAPTTLRDDCVLTVSQNLGENLAGGSISHEGSRRYREDNVATGPPRFVGAHPVLAPLSHPPVAVGVIEQCSQVGIAADDHVAATSAVTSIRPTQRHPVLAAERRA